MKNIKNPIGIAVNKNDARTPTPSSSNAMDGLKAINIIITMIDENFAEYPIIYLDYVFVANGYNR
ncbi:hypothetical protein DERF_011269 [Dermatophagoides farinae]|uniref:Uncharacterized protein n=1 Tax=Dermatophagoides farinae TaxID=6954 RepID=A0A922L4M1_DERFA|nr:hypothetical protein DERF_011269 [Dermatophagoides farinae]